MMITMDMETLRQIFKCNSQIASFLVVILKDNNADKNLIDFISELSVSEDNLDDSIAKLLQLINKTDSSYGMISIIDGNIIIDDSFANDTIKLCTEVIFIIHTVYSKYKDNKNLKILIDTILKAIRWCSMAFYCIMKLDLSKMYNEIQNNIKITTSAFRTKWFR